MSNSKSPPAPEAKSEGFLPRVYVSKSFRGFELDAQYTFAYKHGKFLDDIEYISRQEVDSLVAAARAEAFDAVLEAARKIYEGEMDSDPSDYFYTKKAVEDAKAAEERK